MKKEKWQAYVFIKSMDNSVNFSTLKQNSPDREFSKKDDTTNRILYNDFASQDINAIFETFSRYINPYWSKTKTIFKKGEKING